MSGSVTGRARNAGRALVARVGRATLVLAAAALAVCVAAGLTIYLVFFHESTYRITAQFTATPGLYAGNRVDVLGVPTGTIVSVTPKPDHVDVVLALPTDVVIPAGAKAVMMAPNPVSDRFVELTPAYTGGPVMPAGHTIGLADTVVPLELDSIYSSVDTLSKDLGPGGANAHGELSAVLHQFARLADGNGADLHTTIEKIAAALPALTSHPDDLKRLVGGLDTLTSTLAAHDATINSLYDDLDAATGQLADERETIAAAISNLQQGLAEVVDFLRTNQSHIGGSVKNLDTTLAAVMSEQKALIQTFDTAPLGFQNFNRAIDPHSPCLTKDGKPDNCTGLWGRLDTTDSAASVVKTYCGDLTDSFLPIVLGNAHLAQSNATDTACGAEVGLVQGRSGPPGAPAGPDLDLTHYLGSR